MRRLGLPITAIIDSGKKSVHAWVRIDAKTREEYDEKVALIHQFCSQSIGLDVDRQNKNPSRYSRMADVRRAIDFETDEKGITVVKNWGQQRLLEPERSRKVVERVGIGSSSDGSGSRGREDVHC